MKSKQINVTSLLPNKCLTTYKQKWQQCTYFSGIYENTCVRIP